jgi:hypothetical protein
MMRVLIACERFGRVRDAFLKRGYNATSCDILPTIPFGPHMETDVQHILDFGWDLMIGFPPCVHLCSSGARWFKEKRADGRQHNAISFFMRLVEAPIKYIAIENPIGIMSTYYRKPDQIIQPWQFGHGETKATCLWLKGLPKLVPTNIVGGREPKIHRMGPSPIRSERRSITYQGVADAMADQWGKFLSRK